MGFFPRVATSILVLILTTVYSVFAEIQLECFDCSWQSSSSLQNGEKGQEFCLPEHFQRDKVKTVTCSQGCMTTSMFENDADGPLTTLELRNDQSPGDQSPSQNQNQMSFFTRGCPNGDSTRKSSGCEEKSFQHVIREECFCTSPLCNGAATTSKSWSFAVLTFFYGPILLLT